MKSNRIRLTNLGKPGPVWVGYLLYPPRVGSVLMLIRCPPEKAEHYFTDMVRGSCGDIELESVAYVRTIHSTYKLENDGYPMAAPWVRLMKVATTPDGMIPPEFAHFDNDRDDFRTLPMESWLAGELIVPPEIGGCVELRQFVRNGVQVPGKFVSSTVTGIYGDLLSRFGVRFSTQNSICQMNLCDPLK